MLAQRLGKPPSYVAKYEGGDRRLDVAEYLDVGSAIGFDPSQPLRVLAQEHDGREERD
ncbi:MAG TPA: transcriptional regulator [Stellaceae bacterium]|nr:transcriptional regulator [Stellaceae bacterium]